MAGLREWVRILAPAAPLIAAGCVDEASGPSLPALEESAASAAAAVRSLALDLATVHGSDFIDASSVEVLPGDFAFSELVAWNRILRPRLLQIPGFISIDADERLNRVVVEVEAPEDFAAVLKAVEDVGAPDAAVEPRLGLRPVAARSTSLTSRVRPTAAGLKIGLVVDCTHGWTVRTDQGEEGFLTAAHCTSDTPPGGPTGATVVQPQDPVFDVVGSVLLNPSWSSTWCSQQSTCAGADVLFAESNIASYRVARTSAVQAFNNTPGTLHVAGWWISVGKVAPPWVGLHADKVGNTTGWTRGEITASCVDTVVEYPPFGPAEILCAHRVWRASGGKGDSGAPVFWSTSDPAATLRPFGILFAVGPASQLENGVCDNPSGADCFFYFSEWS